MPGLLDGQLAKQIYAGFKNRLQKGQLWRAGVAASGGLDAYGDPAATDPQTWNMQGFTDQYSDTFRATAGIPEGDVKVCIFAQSLPVRPSKDDKAFINGQWWQLRKAVTDPATALWTCQSFACLAPD